MSDGVILEEEAAVGAAVHSEAEVLPVVELLDLEAVAARVLVLLHVLGSAGSGAALVRGSAELHHVPHVAGEAEAVALVHLPRLLVSAQVASDIRVAQPQRRRQLLVAVDDMAALGLQLVVVVAGVVVAVTIEDAGQKAHSHQHRVVDERARHVLVAQQAVASQDAVRDAAGAVLEPIHRKAGGGHLVEQLRDGLTEALRVAEQTSKYLVVVVRVRRRRAALRDARLRCVAVRQPHTQPPGHVVDLSGRGGRAQHLREHLEQRGQLRVDEGDGVACDELADMTRSVRRLHELLYRRLPHDGSPVGQCQVELLPRCHLRAVGAASADHAVVSRQPPLTHLPPGAAASSLAHPRLVVVGQHEDVRAVDGEGLRAAPTRRNLVQHVDAVGQRAGGDGARMPVVTHQPLAADDVLHRDQVAVEEAQAGAAGKALPAARVGDGDAVAPLQEDGPALRLDGSRLRERRRGGQQRLRETGGGEGRHWGDVRIGLADEDAVLETVRIRFRRGQGRGGGGGGRSRRVAAATACCFCRPLLAAKALALALVCFALQSGLLGVFVGELRFRGGGQRIATRLLLYLFLLAALALLPRRFTLPPQLLLILRLQLRGHYQNALKRG